jgi:hypothetical protein
MRGFILKEKAYKIRLMELSSSDVERSDMNCSESLDSMQQQQ